MERSEPAFKDFEARRKAAMLAQQIPTFKAREEAGFKMSQLTADPNWEFYGRYLEAQRAKAEGYCKAASQAILNLANPLSPQDELKAKLSLANHQGVVEAFNYALDIAKVLITEGEKAAEAVVGLEKKA